MHRTNREGVGLRENNEGKEGPKQSKPKRTPTPDQMTGNAEKAYQNSEDGRGWGGGERGYPDAAPERNPGGRRRGRGHRGGGDEGRVPVRGRCHLCAAGEPGRGRAPS